MYIYDLMGNSKSKILNFPLNHKYTYYEEPPTPHIFDMRRWCLKITVKISVYKLTTQSKIIMLYFNAGQFAIIILN